MICPKCGAELEDGAKFCSVCGEKFEEVAPAEAAPAAEAPAEKPADESATWTLEKDLEPGYTDKQMKATHLIFTIGAYICLPILILNIIFFKDKKFLMHHTNNALVLTIFIAACGIIPFVGWFAGIVVVPFCVVMAVISIIKAIKGQTYKMPILGGIKILKEAK